jgi:hypothetical protein
MKFFLPALALALIATPAKAQQCDENLLTGLDISASVGASGIEMQVAGMAEALSSPPVVQAMTSGPRGCVGFALFLWADGHFPTLIDWRVISSPTSAERVAKEIAGSVSFAVQEARVAGTLTNISTALEHAQQMFATSPVAAPKRIYNTVGDGEDNSGEGPQLISRQMQDAGITINALAFGPSETLDAYLRQNITGGLGSFVMRVRGTDDIAASYRAKFILDISMVQQ